MRNYYDILDIDRAASQDAIKQKYRWWAKVFHPDRFQALTDKEQAAEQLKRINEAYATLSDPKKRADYDRRLEAQDQFAAEVAEREAAEVYQPTPEDYELYHAGPIHAVARQQVIPIVIVGGVAVVTSASLLGAVLFERAPPAFLAALYATYALIGIAYGVLLLRAGGHRRLGRYTMMGRALAAISSLAKNLVLIPISLLFALNPLPDLAILSPLDNAGLIAGAFIVLLLLLVDALLASSIGAIGGAAFGAWVNRQDAGR
ncbi:MAG: J domain-containing protein [Chloroflexi bacterium]|nr:J domain-containing protein [Chloroflexota bacterium]